MNLSGCFAYCGVGISWKHSRWLLHEVTCSCTVGNLAVREGGIFNCKNSFSNAQLLVLFCSVDCHWQKLFSSLLEKWRCAEIVFYMYVKTMSRHWFRILVRSQETRTQNLDPKDNNNKDDVSRNCMVLKKRGSEFSDPWAKNNRKEKLHKRNKNLTHQMAFGWRSSGSGRVHNWISSTQNAFLAWRDNKRERTSWCPLWDLWTAHIFAPGPQLTLCHAAVVFASVLWFCFVALPRVSADVCSLSLDSITAWSLSSQAIYARSILLEWIIDSDLKPSDGLEWSKCGIWSWSCYLPSHVFINNVSVSCVRNNYIIIVVHGAHMQLKS